MAKRLLFSIAGLIVIGVAGFIIFTNKPADNSTKLKVATSIFPLYDITKEIAGDRIEVVKVLPDGASPHTYEVTPQDQVNLSGSSIIFLIGHGLDHFAEDLVRDNNPEIKIVDVDRNIILRKGKDEHESSLNNNIITKINAHDGEEEGDGYDPHYWLSLSNASQIAKNITEELILLDNANKSYYTENYNKFIDKVNQTMSQAKAKIEPIKEKVKLVTFHDAFGYFAEELGIEVVATIEPFPGKEPTPAYIAEVGEIIQEKNIKVLFKEPTLPDTIVNALANDYNVKVETLDPIEGSINHSFLDAYMYNIDTIVKNF